MSIPASQHPDVIEAGRVLATLDDWRAMLFGSMFIIVVLLIERGVAAYSMRQERKEMAAERERAWDTAQKFGTNAELVAHALSTLTTEITVLRALSSRVESSIGEANVR